MPTITPSGGGLGARVTDIDLSRPSGAADFATILRGPGRYGVPRFPGQLPEPSALRDFSLRFAGIKTSVTGRFEDPQVPEVDCDRISRSDFVRRAAAA